MKNRKGISDALLLVILVIIFITSLFLIARTAINKSSNFCEERGMEKTLWYSGKFECRNETHILEYSDISDDEYVIKAEYEILKEVEKK